MRPEPPSWAGLCQTHNVIKSSSSTVIHNEMDMILQDQGQRRCGSSGPKTLPHPPVLPQSLSFSQHLWPNWQGQGCLLWRGDNGGKELNKVTKDQVSAWVQAKDWHQLSCWTAVTQLSYWAAVRTKLIKGQSFRRSLQTERKEAQGKNTDSAWLVRWKIGRLV